MTEGNRSYDDRNLSTEGSFRRLKLEEVYELIRTRGPWPLGYQVEYSPDGTVIAVRGNPYRGLSSFQFLGDGMTVEISPP